MAHAYYGSAIFTVTRVSDAKWRIEFDSDVDISDNVVYLEVMYYTVNSTMSGDIGTLTVTSSDSTTPIYGSTTSYKLGSSSYRSYRRSLILCNSQSYDIEVTNPGPSMYLDAIAFYTSVIPA